MRPTRPAPDPFVLADLLLVEDLAFHLKASSSSIRALLRRGAIPGRKVGRRWVVDRGAFVRSLSQPDATSILRLVPHRDGGDA